MGSASSKVSRKLPTKAAPSWAGARTDNAKPVLQKARASERKDTGGPAIETDAKDPHFMQNLSRLGEVNVDHHMVTVRTDEHMRHILHSRDVSEQQASSLTSTKNRMTAGVLYDLLELRKSVKSQAELSKLASRYDIDSEVLESLLAFANTPSIVEGSRRKILEEDGRERFTTLACWEDNVLTDTSASVSRRS
ncbi:hypothetical protein M0805_009318 [Coniferiporia weirii]|nr:hypothetical protein M0805_009318 [Coniferiporia weirii]